MGKTSLNETRKFAFVYNGILYKSKAEFARKHNFSAKEIYIMYTATGDGIVEDIEQVFRARRIREISDEVKSFKLFDRNWESFEDAVANYHVSRKHLVYMIDEMNVEPIQALSFLSKRKRSIAFIYDGIQWNSIVDAAKYYQIAPSTVCGRIHSGKTIQEAFDDLRSRTLYLRNQGLHVKTTESH